ncbi:MAG: hypothetical protein MJ214_02140 [Bacilli bacterium]|nr:hypothetical protein [Bacilli bacterium]
MKKNFKFLLLIPAVIFPLLIGCKGNEHQSVDFALLRDNFKQMLKDTTSIDYFKNKTKEEIKDEFTTVNISGVDTFKFKNIDYEQEIRRSVYPQRQHLDCALELAIIADNQNDEELKDYVRKLEYYWVFNNYKSPNWYENEIAAIRSLTNVAMFQYDELNDKGKAALEGKVRNSSLYYHPGLELHQGANLIDYAYNTFKNGILQGNADETDCAFNRLMDEIVENNLEGFQSEGTYFQHSKLIATGNYGVTATAKLADFFTTLKGSSYKVPEDKIAIVLNCINVGLKYMTQREYRNWMCQGRNFSAKNPYKYDTNSLRKYLTIEGVSEKDKQTLQTFVDDHDAGKICFNDTKVFPKARVIVSNIDDVYIAFKGCDPTTVNSECLNNENELAYNLSYGMNTAIMQSGAEYNNLSPVCDFSFMPGAVSQDYGFEDIQESNDIKFYKTGDKTIFEKIQALGNERFEDKVATFREDGKTPYVYGMGDELATNKIACCYQQGKHSNKTIGEKTFLGQEFTVACFSTPDGMAILGAGMNDLDEPAANRYVTLQQCILDQDGEDTVTEINDNIVEHNYKKADKGIETNVYYKSLNDQVLTLRQGEVIGNFQRNYSVGKPEEFKANTMITYMPIVGKSYAYSIQTDKNDKFIVAHNSTDIQAIEYGDKIAACFYDKDIDSFEYDTKTYKLTNDFVDGQGAFQVFDVQK